MNYDIMRQRMVDEQLVGRGISDRNVLEAFRKVPRHEFVPEDMRASSYGDYPMPIGGGQTISQPYMVALMTENLSLKGTEKVLEIGTGSGYQAAILCEIAVTVYSVERDEALAKNSRQTLSRLGYANCNITTGDGSLGWYENAPYDGIIVTAGSPGIPQSLIDQLKDGGRLVIPVGNQWSQVLTVVQRTGASIHKREICPCVFVPLIGKEGW